MIDKTLTPIKRALLSVSDKTGLVEFGKFLSEQGLEVARVNKVLEGRPHCEDAVVNGDVCLVINTTEGAQAIADSFSIRRSAVTNNVPHYTTMTAAFAAADGIEALKSATLEVAPLQAYFESSY